MSNKLVFDILPFDPLILPNPKYLLSIDLDDLAAKMREIFREYEIEIMTSTVDGERYISVSFKHELDGRYILATYLPEYCDFQISAWPKRKSKELIYWFRQYIPSNHHLFLIIPEDGFVAEITAEVSLSDLEKYYPCSISDD